MTLSKQLRRRDLWKMMYVTLGKQHLFTKNSNVSKTIIKRNKSLLSFNKISCCNFLIHLQSATGLYFSSVSSYVLKSHMLSFSICSLAVQLYLPANSFSKSSRKERASDQLKVPWKFPSLQMKL